MSNEINRHIDRLKESFLCAAARGGRIQECASLLDFGADVECSENDEDSTPLLAAARNGHSDVAALLLAHGANPSVRDSDGNTVMHLAAARGDEGLVSLFSPNAGLSLSTNDEGMTAIDVAVARGFNSFAEHLSNLLYGEVDEEEDPLVPQIPRMNVLSVDGSVSTSSSDDDSDDDDSSRGFERTSTDYGSGHRTDLDVGGVASNEVPNSYEYDMNHLRIETPLDSGECSEDDSVQIDDTDGDPEALAEQLRHMTQLAHTQSRELYQAKYALNEVMEERDALKKELDSLGDPDLANKSLAELSALEGLYQRALDRISKAKELASSNLEEERVCVICRENPKSVLLMTCRHLCVCKTCGHLDVLVQCPLCREPITERINVFA